MTVAGELAVDARLRAFHERSLQYRRLGYDREAAVRHVVSAAGALEGPALDVGTGKGLLAAELARAGLEVVSVDVNPEEQELARLVVAEAGVADRVRLLTADGARLPFPASRFGSVAMMDVLHHLDEPGPVLREMARVLREGGLAIVADFDEDGFTLVSRVHRGEGREHPRSAATVEAARDELARAGLRPLGRIGGLLHDVAVLRKEPRVPGERRGRP